MSATTARPYETGCWSPTSGAGQTTLNVALAQTLVHLRPTARVLIVDMDLYDGDVRFALGLPTDAGSLLTLVRAGDFSPAAVARTCVQTAAGVDVLAASVDPSDAVRYAPDPVQFVHIRQALHALGYDVVIYDLPKNPFFSATATAVLKDLAEVLMVTNPDKFPGRRWLRWYPTLSESSRKQALVVNNFRMAAGEGYHDLAAKLHLRTVAQIPPDGALGDGTSGGHVLWTHPKFQSAPSSTPLAEFARYVWASVDTQVRTAAQQAEDANVTTERSLERAS